MVENFEDDNLKQEEFYQSLKTKLDENHEFPDDYLFKFIITSSPEKVIEIVRIFDGMKYTLSNRESKKGKYTAISINAFVLDADQVINIYKTVAKVEGVMML